MQFQPYRKPLDFTSLTVKHPKGSSSRKFEVLGPSAERIVSSRAEERTAALRVDCSKPIGARNPCERQVSPVAFRVV